MKIDALTSTAAGYTSATYGTQKVSGTETVQAGSRREADQATISEAGLLASRTPGNLSSVSGVEPRANGAIHLEDVRKQFEENADAFQDEFRALLQKAGIDTRRPIDLTTDQDGKIRVGNGHPEKEKIEALLEDEPELSNRYRGLSNMASLVKAAETHHEFAQAYAQNPREAVARYSHLFGSPGDAFSLRVEENRLSVLFTTQTGTASQWWANDAGFA